jgi:hypothetical protein
VSVQDQFDHMIASQGGHAAEDALLVPNIVGWRPAAAGGTNQGYLVELDGGEEAYFKPLNGINRRIAQQYGQDPASAVLHEVAAWRIARELGRPLEPLVAPCVLRQIDGIDPYAPGALSAIHVDPLRQAFADLQAVFNLDAQGCSSGAFFDSLIAQQDRNLGNLRFDYGAGSYGLIDHGYAFARHGDPWNTSPLVEARASFGDVRLDQWEIDALRQLLGSGDLCTARDGLDAPRADALERRAESMLQPTVLPHGSF